MARRKTNKEEVLEEAAEGKREPLQKRLRDLDALFEAMSSQYGIVAGRPTKSKAVMDRMTFHYIPTPIHALNEALGGGLPAKGMVLIAGQPDSGKTGFLLNTIGERQQADPDFVALWIESEESLDIESAKKLYKLDLARFYCVSTTDPKTNKQVFGAEAIGNAIIAAVREKDVDMCVINSMKMLIPMAETKKSLEEDTMAVQARFNSKFLKKAIPLIAQKETCLCIVEHYSTDLNAGMYGNPNLIAGGKAIRYNNMVTLEFSSVKLEESDPVSPSEGMKVKIRVTKNHCVIDRNPRVAIDYCIEYGKGIERHVTTLQQLIEKGIITQRGAWLYLLDENGEKDKDMSWQGKNAFKADMIANPVKFDTLCSMLDSIGTGAVHALSEQEILELEEEEKNLEQEMSNAGVDRIEAEDDVVTSV